MKTSGLLVCLLAAACASAPSTDTPADTGGAAAPAKKPAEPTVSIARLDVNSAQPRSATSVPMIVRVKVENRTEEAVVVDRIDVSSAGIGPYTISSTAQDFHHEVKVGHVSVFPVWVQAVPSTVEDTIGGQEGSMMVRASVFVTTPTRKQHRLTTVQKVETSLTR
jgi:hypothetical protein